MNIEQLTTTIEQSRHLQKLGLDMTDAAVCMVKWNDGGGYHPIFVQDEWLREQMRRKPQLYVPVYTFQELLDKLPDVITTQRYDTAKLDIIDYMLIYHDVEIDFTLHWESGPRIEAAYEMLCWVIKNKYLNQNKK